MCTVAQEKRVLVQCLGIIWSVFRLKFRFQLFEIKYQNYNKYKSKTYSTVEQCVIFLLRLHGS